MPVGEAGWGRTWRGAPHVDAAPVQPGVAAVALQPEAGVRLLAGHPAHAVDALDALDLGPRRLLLLGGARSRQGFAN